MIAESSIALIFENFAFGLITEIRTATRQMAVKPPRT